MKSKYQTNIKLIVGFSFILTILATLTGIWLSHIKSNSARLANLNQDHRASELIFTMREAARNRTLALTKMMILDDPFQQEDEFDYIMSQAEVFIVARDQLRTLGLSEEEKQAWDVVLPFIRQGSVNQQRTTELILNGNIYQAKQLLLNEVLPIQIKVMDQLTAMLERQKLKLASKLSEAADNNQTVYISIFSLGSIALLIAALIAFLVTKIASKSEKELVIARDTAQSANNQKSQFLANMSHELRTPLNAIIGYSEILHEEARDGENKSLAADLDKIHISGQHLLILINDILDLSKIEANKMDLYPEPLDMRTLVEEVVNTVKPLIKSNQNTLEVSICNNCVDVFNDARKIRQSLLNLLNNAGKFTNQGRIILTISQYKLDNVDWIKIEIEDNGIGMSDKQLENLFIPFSQADASTTRQYGGTGLGLYISKQYCKIMGGSLSVKSLINKGSKFTITIPQYVDSTYKGNVKAS